MEATQNDPKRFPTMSDADYLTLIEHIPAVSYRRLPVVTWPMIFISDEIIKLTGWPAEDFIGLEPKRNFLSIIHPEDQQMVSDIVFETVSQRHPHTVEYRVVTSDGGVKWVFESGQAAFDESGQAVYLDGTIIDVTARKSVEMELAKYRGHLEELVTKRTAELESEVAAHRVTEEALLIKSTDLNNFFDRSTDLLIICDPSGTILRASPSWTEVLKRPAEATYGHPAAEYVHPDDLEAVRQLIQDVAGGKKRDKAAFRILHADGSYRLIEWSTYADGQNVYGVGRDITERHAAMQALRDSEELFRVVFATSPVGMALLRRSDMTCADVNEAMAGMIGTRRADCLGRTPKEIGFFVTEKDITEAEEICELGLAKRNESMEFRHQNGTVLNISLSCEPLKTTKGELLLIFCMPDTEASKEEPTAKVTHV